MPECLEVSAESEDGSPLILVDSRADADFEGLPDAVVVR